MNLVNYNYNENLEPIINFETAVRLRNKAILYADSDTPLPLYLLEPEVNALINSVDELKISFLIKTLWITGARITAILQIKESDFKFIEYDEVENGKLVKKSAWFLSIVHLKNGRKSKKNIETDDKRQLIQIYDDKYINSLRVYVATYNIKPHQRLFNISRQSALTWVKKAVTEANKKGVIFPIPIDTYTFRHSHAVHLLYHSFSKKELQTRLGHKKPENTEIYIKIFELDKNIKIRFF